MTTKKTIDKINEYKNQVILIAGFITFIGGWLSGGWSWVYRQVIESEYAKEREYDIDIVLSTYDSLTFDVGQMKNIIVGEMTTIVLKDSCESHCRYWLKKDMNGALWFQDYVDTDEGRIPTHLYTVTYQRTLRCFQYVDYRGKVRRLPHKWERKNKNEEE